VGFPVAEHSLTRRRQFILSDPSSNDFSNYDVAQSTTKDFDDLIMRQLSHLYFSPTNPSETRENGQWAILRSLLHPEPVHADESLRIFDFELVPSIKVDHRGIPGESRGIGTLLRRTEHEAEELQIVRTSMQSTKRRKLASRRQGQDQRLNSNGQFMGAQ
jgi:hypothetical protein